MSSRPGSARFQAKYAPVYLTETDPADNDSDNDGSNLSHRPVEEDGNESDDELQRQLDQELLALRSLRDEELFGVKHGGDDASSSDESDGDELQQLINYKPRCTFRPMSARRLHSHPLSNGVTSSSRPGTAKNTRPTTANSAHVPPFHSTSDAAASTLATDSIAAPIHFAIDGIELDDSSAPLPRTLVEATLSALASSSTSARRPSSSPRSRPVTASKRKSSSKEEESKSFSTTAGKHHIPILPLPVPITLLPPLSSSPDPADSDGNDGFITNVEHDIAELRLLIAEAPPPSQMQQKLLQDGVDIAQWSKQQRESIAKETVEAQQKFEVQQRLQQEHLASMVAADQKNAQSSSSPENQPNGEDSSTNNAASSPTPTYSPPLLPPLLPSLAPNTDHITKSTTANNLNVDKQLARAREREAALEAFAAEEAANRLRQSQAIEQLRRDEFDQKKKEELYRKIELDNWTKQEEKRLREIKKKKQAREKELLEREAARKTTAFLVRERASMRGADSEARSLRQAKLDAEKREANRVANEKRMREQHAMQKEDERSTVLFQKAQAIRKEEQRRRREHEEAERKERERLEEVRLAATRAAEAEQKRLAEEYAARKREEARIQAEKEAAERARIEKEAEEKRRFEAEAQRMREELLRQQREAEEAERLRLEKLEAERLAAEAEKERLRQEAIARELERKAREEAERRAYFEEQRRRKEEADRAEAERKRIEEEEAERKRKEEEKERKRQEKLLRAQTKAAKLIQRVFRGYHSRVLSPTSRNQYKQLRQWKSARFVRHSRAATTIQAQARGWLLRRKLARIRSHAAHGLMDVDDGDEFDYGGIDPSFYTIQGLDEFEMNLPPEAMEMLKSAQMGDRSALVKQQTQQLKAQGLMGGINSNSNKKLPTHDRHVNVALEMERKFQATHQLTPVQNTNNQPQATLSKQRVSSAGTANASKLSSSGRGGLVSSQHSSGAPSPNISPPSSAAASQFLPPQQQNMRVNNFFGGQPSQQQPQQPQRLTQASLQQYDQQLQCDHAPPAVTKFPSLSTPTNNTQARVSTAHSDASDISHRSADHSARPESSFPSNVSVASLNSSPISGTSSKAAKLAELSAAWGVSDPRTLEALLKKKQKLAKMKSAKKAANMTADERYEKFQRASGTGGGGGKKKKKKGAAPPAWLTGGGQQASAGGVDSGDDDDDDGGEDDDVDDDRSSTASGIVASMTSNFRPLPHQNSILPLQSLSHSSSNRMDTSLLSPASSASSTYASSRSIAAPQSNFSFPTAVNTSAAAQPGGWMNAAASLKSSSGVIVNRKR